MGCLKGNAHLELLCDRLDNLHHTMSGIDLLTQTQQPKSFELLCRMQRFRPVSTMLIKPGTAHRNKALPMVRYLYSR